MEMGKSNQLSFVWKEFAIFGPDENKKGSKLSELSAQIDGFTSNLPNKKSKV